MGVIEDGVLKLIANRLPGALAAETEAVVAVNRARISTPYPPASAPYTPPHLREGYLHAGQHHFQIADTSTYTSVVVSSRPDPEGDPDVVQALEFGHGNVAPRPHMEPSMTRVRETFLANLGRRMQV